MANEIAKGVIIKHYFLSMWSYKLKGAMGKEK